MDIKQEKSKLNFGLVGKDISYSFSKSYFEEKFKREKLPHSYSNFDINDISEFAKLIEDTPNLKGLNVTIPYKEVIIPKLDQLSKRATKIGAVNTIKITKSNKLIGYNTDYYGFKKSLKPFLKPYHKNALIMGTGGASKAIAHVLKKLNINFVYVNRTINDKANFVYTDLTADFILNHSLIINCTPLGTYPNIDQSPIIPYQALTEKHILFDLVYNPAKTKFLQLGAQKGAVIINGSQMLRFQAEKAWRIWNKD